MVNSINMPVSRERMEKYQNKHMRQIEHAAKQVEARESKTKNNNMRRVWLQRQTNSNYRTNMIELVASSVMPRSLSKP